MNKKHIAIGLSAIIALAGCSMEEQVVNEDVLSGEKLTIEASREAFGLEEGSPETRTIRDEESKSVLWVPGDAISLFYGSGADGGSKFTSTLESGSSEMTNFTGTITAITGGGELTVDDTYFWGVYPYGEDVSCDGHSVTVTLPTLQEATPGTFATNTFLSVGRSQGLIMGFYNICGGWRFSVTKEGIKKVTLKSNGGEPITGKVKVKFDDAGVPAIDEVLDGSDEVVLEAPAGKYFEVNKNYYMVLLPTVLESGFTMTFETFTEEGEYNRAKKTTIARSKFSGIDKLDTYLTTPYAKKTGPIPVEDANFKAYLVENFDTDGDGEISYEEALEITAINVCTDDIESVQGIEYMPNLYSLICNGTGFDPTTGGLGRLTVLDISNNQSLEYLDCSDNQLTDLDLSANTALRSLYCSSNWISNIDVSNNIALEVFWCQGQKLESNQLVSLDLSNNTALTVLQCSDNLLTELDLSNNTALGWIHCASNRLSNIILPSTETLHTLWCDNNQLTSLDVSKNTALTQLWCYANQLTSLDMSANAALTYLDCWANQLTSLDVSKNTALTGLYCGSNQLTSLDVSANTELTDLNCGFNQLTSLDVSANAALTHLDCGGNQLTSLDVSNNTALTTLRCYNNQLTSLDVSANTALRDLSCGENLLASLDVSANTALTYLWCANNQLTSLDVSNNTALTDLDCSRNQLTSLDVSKNTALSWLRCSPMNDASENNLLSVLYITQGQQIPNVTVDRNVDYVPVETMIMAAPKPGTNEGTEDEELTP